METVMFYRVPTVTIGWKKWKKSPCSIHMGQIQEVCSCEGPYSLHRFPSAKLNVNRRKEWTRLINRTTAQKTACTPGESDLVCSKHFVDGKPTLDNPEATLNLGYCKPQKQARIQLIRLVPDLEKKMPDEPIAL